MEEKEIGINIFNTYLYYDLYDYHLENNRDTIFLTYSCYIPNIQYKDKQMTRKEFIMPIIKRDVICYMISYLILFIFKIWFNYISKTQKINIKDLTLMIDTIDIPRKRLPYALNDIIKGINEKLEKLKEKFDSSYSRMSLKEIN